MIHIKGNGGHAKVVRDLVAHSPHWDDAWIIAVGNNADRKAEAERLADLTFCTLIHSRAYVAPDVTIGAGTVVMAGAVIQPGSVIGKHCIVNTNAVVDHDATLSDFVHIAPGAVLCGGVTVGEGAFVGAGAVVAPQVYVEAWSFHKAGSVIK